jgi:hypothetical protein
LVISFERKIGDTKVTDPDADWENDALDSRVGVRLDPTTPHWQDVRPASNTSNLSEALKRTKRSSRDNPFIT